MKPIEVQLLEVSPRDGLQNEDHFLATKHKISWINCLSETGLSAIEVSSFVSAKAIQQLADAEAVFRGIHQAKDVVYSALIPNEQGMLQALALGVREIAIFTAASESFNQHNIHCSIAESLQRFLPVMQLAKTHHIRVRAYISCVLGCPYEGLISPAQVLRVAEQLMALGVDEIDLGDTIGVGTVKQTKDLLTTMMPSLASSQIALHFHDTYGQAIANIHQALELGIRRFDSSVAGIGGCPYARGASGNVATEDVLYLLHGLGLDTGIDIFKVVHAGDMICRLLGRRNQSKVANALLANQT